jgi:hypothetical protein
MAHAALSKKTLRSLGLIDLVVLILAVCISVLGLGVPVSILYLLVDS